MRVDQQVKCDLALFVPHLDDFNYSSHVGNYFSGALSLPSVQPMGQNSIARGANRSPMKVTLVW